MQFNLKGNYSFAKINGLFTCLQGVGKEICLEELDAQFIKCYPLWRTKHSKVELLISQNVCSVYFLARNSLCL